MGYTVTVVGQWAWPEPTVSYHQITAWRVDRDGNLRLYRRGRAGWPRQDVDHPAAVWASFTVTKAGGR